MLQYRIMVILAIVFVIAYSPRWIAWFGAIRPQKKYHNDKVNKFAVIIPARNEGEAVIPLLTNLTEQTYDKEYYDVFVVVKEYDDPVIGYADSFGAKAYVAPEQRCKGDALDHIFRELLKEYPDAYDAYITIDADCKVEPDFLSQMNDAMASGASVITAKKIVANYDSENEEDCNIVTCCNGLIWTMMDDMGNRFKSDHGLTHTTISCCFLLTSELVKSWGCWPYKETLTEDMEMERDCALKGVKTLYYSYAHVYMQEAPSLRDTNKRRNRWLSGLILSDKLYYSRLKERKGIKALIDNYYIYSLWIVFAYIGILYVFMCFDIVATILCLIFGNMTACSAYCHAGLFAFGLIYVTFLALTAVAMIVDYEHIKLSPLKKLELLLTHPIFYMGYIKICAKGIFGGREPEEWEEIERIDTKGMNRL